MLPLRSSFSTRQARRFLGFALRSDLVSRLNSRARSAGFMMVETVISLSLLVLFTALAYAAMLAANRHATANRLYTLAQEMARDQIDRVLSASPFNPQFSPPLGPQVPNVLTLDTDRGGAAEETLPLYVDPKSSKTMIEAKLTTSIRNVGVQNARAATVTVAYRYRGRPYTVVMNTLRTSDS